jgi:hypothetical protein
MSGGLGRLFRARSRPERAALTRLKAMVLAMLALADEATIAVNEIVCADPACPGLETVILVMEPGKKTRAVKIALAAEEIGEAELAAALAGAPD